jgi:hypothetical protein
MAANKLETSESVTMNQSNNSIYNVNISIPYGVEYVPYMNDMLRMITIQIILQLMLSLRQGSIGVLFSWTLIEVVLYVILGCSMYWLVVRNLITFS